MTTHVADDGTEHSVESARWYWARLCEMSTGQLLSPDTGPVASLAIASIIKNTLLKMLTPEELRILR